jgi:hypothetical protein
MKFRHLAKFSILLALPAMITAQARPTECLTRTEMRSGISYIMPMLINAVKNACANTLPKGSFLTDGSADMLSKYQALAASNKAAALSLIDKFGAGMKLDSVDTDGGAQTDMMEALLPIMVEEGLAKEIKPESCTAMNDIVESLDPLPPENMTRLIETIAVEVIRSDEAKEKTKGSKKGSTSPKSLLCS